MKTETFNVNPLVIKVTKKNQVEGETKQELESRNQNILLLVKTNFSSKIESKLLRDLSVSF